MSISINDAVWVTQPRPDQPLLILMHGYGADERDLLPLTDHLPADMAVVSVRAPRSGPLGGHAWFSIATDPGSPELAEADAAATAMLDWIQDAQAQFGHHGPIHLLGFSQGGAMAIHLLRHAPEQFASAVALSGFLVPGTVTSDAALAHRRPPVFWGYDRNDPIVPAPAFERTKTFLTAHTHVDERRHNAGHGISSATITDIAQFLQHQVAAPGA